MGDLLDRIIVDHLRGDLLEVVEEDHGIADTIGTVVVPCHPNVIITAMTIVTEIGLDEEDPIPAPLYEDVVVVHLGVGVGLDLGLDRVVTAVPPVEVSVLEVGVDRTVVEVVVGA